MDLPKQIAAGVSGLDIIHGELKNLMYQCESDLSNVSELQDLPQYEYLSGMLEAFSQVYALTYELSFAGAK